MQFCPVNNKIILYNHEWCSDSGIRRMWLWDGERHIRLRSEDKNRSRKDWTCHEMWSEDGKYIIYHGIYKNGIAYVGRINMDGSKNSIEIPFRSDYRDYGHFSVGPNGLLVSNEYYQEDEDFVNSNILEDKTKKLNWSNRDNDTISNENGRWISIVKANWDNRDTDWIPLCKHDSNWDSQDSHPHPIINHSGTAVYFNSNRDGNLVIYKVDIEK